MERILVTGGAGFVGFEVALKLANDGDHVTVVDSLENGLYPNNEKIERKLNLRKFSNLEFVQADLSDPRIYKDLGSFSSAIHLAAMPGLRYSWESPSENIRCNVLATSRLLDALPNLNVSRFIHISTSSVYGSTATGHEGSPLRPESPYGVTKLAAEGLVSAMLGRVGISYSIVRLFSVYGPGQRPDMAYRRFLSSIITDTPQVIFGDGSQIRTNTYVADAAEGVIGALWHGRSGATYNIGGEKPISVNEAIAFMEDMTGSKMRRIQMDRVVGDQRETRADVRAATEDFGFNNSTSLWDGLRAEYDWLLQHPELVEQKTSN
jgi:UDP-glucuronate 4-epimerase